MGLFDFLRKKKEIAQITGLTDVNVKVKMHRARKRFADILEQMMRYETS